MKITNQGKEGKDMNNKILIKLLTILTAFILTVVLPATASASSPVDGAFKVAKELYDVNKNMSAKDVSKNGINIDNADDSVVLKLDNIEWDEVKDDNVKAEDEVPAEEED